MKRAVKAAIFWWSLPFWKATETPLLECSHYLIIFIQSKWCQGFCCALHNLPLHPQLSTKIGIYVCRRQSPSTTGGGAGLQVPCRVQQGRFASFPKPSSDSSACNNFPEPESPISALLWGIDHESSLKISTSSLSHLNSSLNTDSYLLSAF